MTRTEPTPFKLRSRVLRAAVDRAARVFAGASAALGLAFLFWILATVFLEGASALTPGFFTHSPPPPGDSGGGMGSAVLGTLLITGFATLLGVPLGVLAGVFLSEVAPRSRLASWVRFL
ncbi:MAG: phosphate ABC transporter permease PtsA, partial [Deltaproteobacteria bacterium]|nr:phosphate ABC transporter permease PtsA [Deltaproteobacteria bacterium]